MARKFTTDDPSRGPRQTAGRSAEAAVVTRRCEVCEWEETRLERPGENPDCPWCHAPTAVHAPATAEDSPRKNPHAAALGRLGGLKGGPARAQRLTAKQRREIAIKAARERWKRR
jgi:hypothetical protein